MLTRMRKLGAGALIVLLLAGCGGSESDSDAPDNSNAGVAFAGVFKDENGLVIELNGSDAHVRALGSSPFGQTGSSFNIGDRYMVGMAERGPGEWRGYVAYISASNVVLLDWASVTIADGVLSLTDAGGVERTFIWIAAEWQPNMGGGVTPLISGMAVSGTGSWMDELKHFVIDVPQGATTLSIDLTGEASMLVKFNQQATLNMHSDNTLNCYDNALSFKPGNCTIANPAAGPWYIALSFLANSNYTITATVSGSSEVTAFDGIWSNPSKTVKMQGVGSRINFYHLGYTFSVQGWYDAQQKGFIAIGDPWIRNITPAGSNKWTAEVLWNKGNTITGVTGVAWSANSTLSLANGGATLVVVSTSPFDGLVGTSEIYRE